MEGGEMSCICQRCGQAYYIDVLIPDDLWKEIAPKPPDDGLLCGPCILLLLEELYSYDVFLLLRPSDIKERFENIIHGEGLTIPRQLVRYAVDDIIGKAVK